MNRPRLMRPTVSGINGANPMLTFPDGSTADLDAPEFASFIARLEPFSVEFTLGRFMVIAERRRRQLYWIARGYHAGVRASAYVGRRVDAASLGEASDLLRRRLTQAPPPHPRRATSTDENRLELERLIEQALDGMSAEEQAVHAKAYERLLHLERRQA